MLLYLLGGYTWPIAALARTSEERSALVWNVPGCIADPAVGSPAVVIFAGFGTSLSVKYSGLEKDPGILLAVCEVLFKPETAAAGPYSSVF